MGVTCVDYLMRDLIGTLTAFKNCKGEHIYSFMLDQNGRYMYHPLLPESMYTADPPVYLEFASLEHDEDVINNLRDAMIRYLLKF